MKETLGEYRVGIDFNPSANPTVKTIKKVAANLIYLTTLIEAEPDVEIPEVERLKALAMTAFEEGAMWAVKAATKRARKE